MRPWETQSMRPALLDAVTRLLQVHHGFTDGPMPPSRRKVLQAMTAAVPVGLAGCMSGGASTTTDPSLSSSPTAISGPTSTPPATPETTPPENSGGLDDFDPTNIHERIEVGSREGVKEEFKLHDLGIWNTVGSEQSVSVRVLDRLAETAVHRAEYSIPADEAVRIGLLTPSKYYVQLGGAAIDSPETLLVPCERFDCNESKTQIGIFESGAVRSTVLTTLAQCPSLDC